MALAGEFEKYAPDIVHQGTQSVGKLAAELWRYGEPYSVLLGRTRVAGPGNGDGIAR